MAFTGIDGHVLTRKLCIEPQSTSTVRAVMEFLSLGEKTITGFYIIMFILFGFQDKFVHTSTYLACKHAVQNC